MTRAMSILTVTTVVLASAAAGQGIPDQELGLTKNSVYETPAPPAYRYPQAMPGTTRPLPRSYSTAPPQIPHNIDHFVPITAGNNACMGCHHNPSLWGRPRQTGMPTPIPESHYVDPAYGRPEAGLPGRRQQVISNARYNCVQCHAPQADAEPLVQNTFQPAE